MLGMILLVIGVFLTGFGACQDLNQHQRNGYDDRSIRSREDSTRPYSNNPRRFDQYNRENQFRPDIRYQDIQNVRTENQNNEDGSYNYFFENNDGTIASQKGFLKAPRSVDGDPIQVAEGFYQYYSPEGKLLRVDYISDENGFQPRGEHLPTPPPIPEAIQKSLDLIYANIDKQKLNRKSYDYQNEYKNQNPYGYRPDGPKIGNRGY